LDPPPFEPLQFPLSKEVYQRLLAEMNIEPKAPRLSLPVTTTTAKRTKSKSVSSNGGNDGGNPTTTTTTNSGSRRSSKAKATNASKLAQTTTTMLMTQQRLNGSGKNAQRATNGGGKNDYAIDAMDYGPEDEEDEEEEEEELLLEEDDDYHHYLAPPDDDPLPAGVGDDDANLYNASIDAYLGEQEGIEEEELADDPFMDDDPNDPEWKRSVVRHERMRKRV